MSPVEYTSNLTTGLVDVATMCVCVVWIHNILKLAGRVTHIISNKNKTLLGVYHSFCHFPVQKKKKTFCAFHTAKQNKLAYIELSLTSITKVMFHSWIFYHYTPITAWIILEGSQLWGSQWSLVIWCDIWLSGMNEKLELLGRAMESLIITLI